MRKRNVLIATLTVFCVGCSSYPSAKPSAPRVSVALSPSASLSIEAEQAALVRAYYANGSSGRGRGRGRNGGLPPGIAKNLQRGKPLPPGITKQYLPSDVLNALPPLTGGFEYVVVAGKLLLVEIATQVIHDVLLDVVFD